MSGCGGNCKCKKDDGHLWGQFLEIRAKLIDEFVAEGSTDSEIAKVLSMDAGQVMHIRLREC